MGELQQIEQLVQSNFRLVAIETHHEERIIALFKRLGLTTGRAVYEWSADEGIYRLGYEHIVIPRTRRAADALDYIHASIHFGVYLLQDFSPALQDTHTVELLKKIAGASDKPQHLIILVDDTTTIPAELKPFTVRVKHALRQAS